MSPLALVQHLFSSPRQLVPILVGTHLSLSMLSIINSQLLPAKYNLDDDNGEECFDAGHYTLVQEFVGRLYQGEEFMEGKEEKKQVSVGSITGHPYGESQPNNNNDRQKLVTQGVRLAPKCIFEDPAAVCEGTKEVREAFRALRALHPQPMSTPQCMNVHPKGDRILLTYALHQQYTLPLYGPFRMRSILQVTVQLKSIPELAESEFLILQMKELWGGKPFAWPNVLYYPSRRLNGMLSYRITSWLL